MGNFNISMAIFNSELLQITRGYHFARSDVGDLLDDPHGTPTPTSEPLMFYTAKRCMLQGGYSIYC